MQDNKRILAIIPARGGSKRLPRKNLLPLLGKPLISYTIKAAIASNCFETIAVSSDDEEILSIARTYPEVEAHSRKPELAADTTKVWDLVQHYVERDDLRGRYGAVTLLLPTCPFRTAEDIQSGLELLIPEVDSVVSVTTFEFPPQLSVLEDPETGLLTGLFEPCGLLTGNTRSQDQAICYRPNGAFYISWWTSFQKHKNFFRGAVRLYKMPRLRSIDIDDEVDFEYAEHVYKTKILNQPT